jgi:hypothetical protein
MGITILIFFDVTDTVAEEYISLLPLNGCKFWFMDYDPCSFSAGRVGM